ncbi:MAG: Stp1/IreP family PP2C-type Ser/Thr phosphatase [Clostridiales bacterium]|nr:Stp1/IreP family PP2C-type Ser/Thr phosphatase [Clostridiales bacterium]
MQAEFLSHVGAVRKNNEDAIFCDVKAGLFIVADGIGGRQAGEVASATAVRVVAEKFWDNPEADAGELMREGFYEANDILHRAGKKEQGMHGMGTTMTATAVNGDNIRLVHVGDSRAYLFSRAGIRQLTEDHTLAHELLKDGQINEAEMERHPQRHILVRSLGPEPLVHVDEYEFSWQKGDFLLLCSDGLYTLVSPQEMRELTLRAIDLKSAVDFMAQTAFNRGGYDNISIILVHYD